MDDDVSDLASSGAEAIISEFNTYVTPESPRGCR
jgi:hypothetical protein